MVKGTFKKALTLGSIWVFLLVFSTGFAFAGTIIDSGWFVSNNGPLPAGPRNLTLTDWDGTTESIALNQFDPSLGTLNSVTISFYADADSTGSITNNSAGTVTVNQYDAFLRVRLLVPGVTTPANIGTAYLLEVQPLLVSVTPGTTITSGGSIVYGPVTDSSASSGPTTYTTGLTPYIGTGTILFPLFTNTRTMTDLTGGNLDITQTTLARAQATITYDYTSSETPEPATTVLLGSALVGISVLRFRKR